MNPAGRLAEDSAAAKPFLLPRDEMAFRGRYQGLLLNRQITTVFRPGDRTWPNWRGYVEGETVNARVIERAGCDALRVAPRFNRVRVPIRIHDLAVLNVEQLTPEDFEGSSADVFDRDSLLAHLFEIYGQPIEAYGGQVTRIRFTYAGQRWARPSRRW
jgi:hypothetical protein